MTKYSQIVFIQDSSEIEEFEAVLDNGGWSAAFDYLLQWDTGDDYDVRDESSAGSSDQLVWDDDRSYLISYNSGVGYVGLQAILPR